MRIDVITIDVLAADWTRRTEQIKGCNRERGHPGACIDRFGERHLRGRGRSFSEGQVLARFIRSCAPALELCAVGRWVNRSPALNFPK